MKGYGNHRSGYNKIIGRLLRFGGILRTKYFWFEEDCDENGQSRRVLHVDVKPWKNGCRCPKCGRRGTIANRHNKGRQRDVRRWRDIPLGEWHVVLHYRPKDIICPTHGRIQEAIPWADPHSRNTCRFEYRLLQLCKEMTQKDAAELLGIPVSTLGRILHSLIDRHREGHVPKGLRKPGIDEVSYRKGHRYLTVVYDLETRRVIWIGKGKARETIDKFFNEVLSESDRKAITVACCDMSKTYMSAIKDHLPNATLVIDKFHIMQAFNKQVDEVRRSIWRDLNKEERKEIKSLRFILLKNSKNRTEEDEKTLKKLNRKYRQLTRLVELKDRFCELWKYSDRSDAEAFLKKWCKTALLSRIEPLRQFVKTIKNHWDGVLEARSGITNAAAEGLNRIIRMIKNRASGFRRPENFANLIYLCVGDLDICAQYPEEQRAGRLGILSFWELEPVSHRTCEIGI